MNHFKSHLRLGLASLCSLLIGLAIVGCESDDDDDDSSSTSSIDVSGAWSYSDTANTQSTWALVQSSNGTITGAGTGGGTITGSISSATISLGLVYADSSTATLSGNSTTNVMTGTFTNSASVNGTWAAVKTN